MHVRITERYYSRTCLESPSQSPDIKNVVPQDRRSLVTGSITLKCKTCLECVVFQERWSLLAVVSQDTFFCSKHWGIVT